MTLDEAIKHAEEVANNKCNECGQEHRQLAEWLKDYKRLLEQEPILDKIRDEILKLDDADYDFEGYYKAVTDALAIIDKYRGEEDGKID